MGTPRRAYPSLSPYSLSDTHITASQQSPTFHYDSNDRQRLYTPSEHHYSSYSNNPRVRTSADTSTSKQSSSMGMLNSGLGVEEGGSGTMKRTNKTHVPSACVNCKRAHLACDVSRPCKRCVALGKVDTCIDIKHKKRGRPKQQAYSQQDNTPIITMFLAIDNIACARVSDECLGIMGYYPSELVHKTLYEYVHAQDREKLRKMISSLLDDANRFHNQTTHHYQFSSPLSEPVTTEDPGFSQISPEILQLPAQGGQVIEISDVLHLKQRIGPYDLYEVRMYLGGGFCADLTRKETWNKLYIVSLFKRIKSGTSFLNEGSNYVQPRMKGSSVVGGFPTQITSPPTTTIDPSFLGGGRLGLLSPVLSPRQIPEIGPAPLYNETNHSSHTYFGHRKPLHPYNSHDHFSQDRNVSETFSSFVSRPNPITPIISRHEPLVSPPTCSPSGSQSPFSFERRPSAFNSVRSPIPFYNEIENKSLDPPSYTNQSNRFHNNNDDNATFHSHQNDHDEISSDNSLPTFRNNGRVEDMMISPIPRKASSHVSAVGDDSASTTRMSVNSLLCN
ncbi:10204_t:CDS:2 [Rhizophagus irregularis]|nr:10204_t:CDS:2 [Rhizophagus irregularis]